MRKYGKYKKVSIKTLKIGDKVAICSLDGHLMKPNKKSLVRIDEERLNLLLEHKNLNYCFADMDGMNLFCEEYNHLARRVKKYL